MNTPPDNDGESAPTDEVLSGEVVATPDGADSVDGSPEQPGDLPGALGGLDMGAMLQMAQDMGERMQEAQEALATEQGVRSPRMTLAGTIRAIPRVGMDHAQPLRLRISICRRLENLQKSHWALWGCQRTTTPTDA